MLLLFLLSTPWNARADSTDTAIPADSTGDGDPAVAAGPASFAPAGARAVLLEEAFARYAILTWSDALAAIPGGRVDRFGPLGFYETYRVDGLGAPAVLYEGIPVPGAGNGLANGNALPFAAVGRLAVTGPGIETRDARANADGAILLAAEPWAGGIPRSLVWVDQGASGYQRYLGRFSRDIGRSTYVRAHFQFRQSSSFVPVNTENYRGREVDLRLGGSLGAVRYELGYWDYGDEQYVFDDSLRGENGFSHTGEEKKQIARLRLTLPRGSTAQLYATNATLDAAPLAGDTALAGEERRDGVVIAAPFPLASGAIVLSARAERREATAGATTRDRWESGGFAEVSRPFPLGVVTARAGGVIPSGTDGAVVGNGELRIERTREQWGSHVSLVRARREASAEQFARGADHFGIANQVEVGMHGPGAEGTWRLRYAFRYVEDALVPLAVDPFFSEYYRYEESAHIAEASCAWDAGPAAAELSYLFSRSREEGADRPPPYQSDHVVRGRVALSRVVPYIQALGRIDLLGEWRSDRFAPGRDVPMDDYYYLRGRFTLELRGADVYCQAERVTGHRLEYRDGIGGAAGVLSGTFQIYFGVRWPLED